MSVPYSAMCLLQALTCLISIHKTLRSKHKNPICFEKIVERFCSCGLIDAKENIEDDKSCEDWY